MSILKTDFDPIYLGMGLQYNPTERRNNFKIFEARKEIMERIMKDALDLALENTHKDCLELLWYGKVESKREVGPLNIFDPIKLGS